MRHPLLDDPFFRRFFDIPNARGRERKKQSLGSGVIVDATLGGISDNYPLAGRVEGDSPAWTAGLITSPRG